MVQLFLSHSSADDGFVRELREALADLGQEVWIDSRQLRGGDPLESAIQAAIEAAAGLAVLVSPASLQSLWVGKELRHGLKLQAERGRTAFPVIPLSLNGTRLGVLEDFFAEEPTYIPVSDGPSGATAALHDILVALGLRLPTDRPPLAQPRPEPVAELLLELSDLGFDEQDGVRRPAARARLVYEPATPGQPNVASDQMWRLIAPLGPIEAEELRWYLERWPVWPNPLVADRAKQVVPLERRQICWAHVIRDLTAIAERPGASAEFGAELLELQRQLFAHWHRYKEGAIDWPSLQQACVPIRQSFEAALRRVVELSHQSGERTPWAKTVGTCRRLLPVADGLWTFLKIKGIEPTNNAAERALRQSVIQRKISHGVQSRQGAICRRRLLTVTTTLRQQGRDVWPFLEQAWVAYHRGGEMPSLLPDP